MARSKSQSQEIESLVASKVKAALDAKIAEYRKIVYAFFVGLGLIVALLVGNHLISNKSLILMIHDAAFGSNRTLDAALRQSVAVSYSNHFWLSQSEKDTSEQTISFYAASSQSVVASIEIKHSGSGRSLQVTAHLDDVKIFQKAEDYSDELLLDEYVSKAHFKRPNNVRRLIFRLDDSETETQDRVLIRVLINVKGLEERTQ